MQHSTAQHNITYNMIVYKDLRQKKANIYRKKHSMALAISRFKSLVEIFVKKKGPPAVPGDYEESKKVSVAPKHRRMFREEGATELASIGLKYGPQKSDLLGEWKKSKHTRKYWEAFVKKSGFHVNENNLRKLRLMVTLQQVAKNMHKKNQELWVDNCGRGVSQKLGPVMWLKKYGVIQKKR